jgi:hypothetical protein
MTTTAIAEKKDLINSPVNLPIGQTSGKLSISIPFPADYIMIINPSPATLAVCVGEVSDQTQDAQIFSTGQCISMPLIKTTQKLTVFWSSPSVIQAANSLVQFYFSNVSIHLQVGNIINYATSLVTVNGFNSSLPAGNNLIGHVDVDQLPALPAGTNNIGHINVDQLPALPAGTNNIGKVDLNNTNQLIQGITAGPLSSSQITVSTAAIALVNGVVNGKKIKIKNIDATNSIFIGSSSVSATNGYELFPKDSLDLDVVPGSTIAIYAIATAGSPIASVLTIN